MNKEISELEINSFIMCFKSKLKLNLRQKHIKLVNNTYISSIMEVLLYLLWDTRLWEKNLPIIYVKPEQIIPICPFWVNGSFIFYSFLFSYELLPIQKLALLHVFVNNNQEMDASPYFYCHCSDLS